MQNAKIAMDLSHKYLFFGGGQILLLQSQVQTPLYVAVTT